MAINDYRVAVGCRDNPDVILDFVGRSVIDAGDIALAESFGEDWLTQVCDGRLFVSDLHRVVGDQSNALNAGSIEFQPPVFSQLWIGDLEAKTAAEINVARAIIGLQSLAVDPTMSNFAREHSLVMARAESIFHSTGNPFGENVLLTRRIHYGDILGVPVSKAGVGSSSKLAEEAANPSDGTRSRFERGERATHLLRTCPWEWAHYSCRELTIHWVKRVHRIYCHL